MLKLNVRVWLTVLELVKMALSHPCLKKTTLWACCIVLSLLMSSALTCGVHSNTEVKWVGKVQNPWGKGYAVSLQRKEKVEILMNNPIGR